ncbi:MAG TPA: hypothetical protein DC000_07195 [Clostridiales bacterium]|nr:hypothetical protein [Clostridiales bacterium]
MDKNKLGIIGLVFVVMFWGAGFPLIKFASESITPLYQIGFRFLIASIFLGLIFFKKLKNIDKKVLKSSFILSIALFFVFLCTVFGMQYTTSTNASFFCCLAILIVPFLSRIFLKEKIKAKSIVCIVICFVGLYLVSFSGGTKFNIGDLLCLGSSLSFAVQIILTEVFVKDCDTDLLTVLEMFFVSIYGLIAAVIFEPFPMMVTTKSVLSLLFIAFFCTCFAFYMQTKCQKFLSSTQISIIFTLEPLFGVLMSSILLSETLGINGIFGGILIIIALFVSEVNFKFLKKPNTSVSE